MDIILQNQRNTKTQDEIYILSIFWVQYKIIRNSGDLEQYETVKIAKITLMKSMVNY